MPHDVVMPALGMAQESGTLVRWLVAEGDRVEKGAPLMEVETDKAVVELEAPATGVLVEVRAGPGDVISVGSVIALIDEARPVPRAGDTQELPRVVVGTVRPGGAAKSPPGPSVSAPSAPRKASSPKARRLARELEVDLGAVAGSGPGGAVLAADVLGLAPAADPVQAPVPPASVAPAPEVTALWRAMAENTARSWRQVPHFFLFREVEASALHEAAQARVATSPEVTHTDLLVRLVAEALRRHPRLNSGNDEVNVGIAVAVDAGLIVVVVHGADRLRLAEIAGRRARLVAAARSGRMKASDLQGATFTVSNLGMYGVDAFTAIVSEGQAAILAVGRIRDRVVAVDGRPAVRPTLQLCLACDHRAVDGARGAEFLATLTELIEAPANLLG